jgi:hypothetical protein
MASWEGTCAINFKVGHGCYVVNNNFKGHFTFEECTVRAHSLICPFFIQSDAVGINPHTLGALFTYLNPRYHAIHL